MWLLFASVSILGEHATGHDGTARRRANTCALTRAQTCLLLLHATWRILAANDDYRDMYTPERHHSTPPHQVSAGIAPSSTAAPTPPHHRHGEHSPTARQPHTNGLCSLPKEGPDPGSALWYVDTGPSTERPDARIHTQWHYP